MTDEEIEKKAKEYAKGNYYSEQGFLYGYELGLAEGRKESVNVFAELNTETSESNARLLDEVEDLRKENTELEEIRGQQARIINNDTDRIERLEKENTELKEALNNYPETASVTQLMELIQVREENERLTKKLEEMKAELHHRLVSPSHNESDLLDKIASLDRLWQFGQEF